MKTKELIRFLKDKCSKDRPGVETAILSDSILAEEWLTQEEDEAWEDL